MSEKTTLKTRIWAFVVYSILYETLVWGIFGWAVFCQGRSGWWLLFAIMLSGAQFKPDQFGITIKEEKDE